MPQTNKDAWLVIVQDYIKATRKKEYAIAEVVAWAREHGRWKPCPRQIIKLGIAQCRNAIRHATVSTASGGEMRQFIAARVRQKDLWTDARSCTYEFAAAHVRQQCHRIGSDHAALESFVREFNTNYLKPGQPPLKMEIDWEASQHEVA
jgi:hypothetical protein